MSDTEELVNDAEVGLDVAYEYSLGEKLLDLGAGLELWRCKIADLREQDVNARSMTKDAFDRLTATVQRDNRLESLPLCALTERRGKKQVEIVSGHHRVRAARAAGLSDIIVIVDVTGLSDDEIKAKQLAHNSIAGHDDPQLIRRIFESIERADSRIEAFIDPKAIDVAIERIPTGTVDLGMQFKTAVTMFVPYDLELFEKCQEVVFSLLAKSNDRTYIADIAMLEHWKTSIDLIGEAYDIKAIGSVIAKMSEIVLNELGDADGTQSERQHIRDVFKGTMVPTDTAELVERAFEKAEAEGICDPRTRWKALEHWASSYVGGPLPSEGDDEDGGPGPADD